MSKVINNQPVKPVTKRKDGILSVHSMFKTIQGEGPQTGRSAVFLRLSGYNLVCPGCDTEYTEGAEELHYSDVANELAALDAGAGRLIVITGGEPNRQGLLPLLDILLLCGFDVALETNGTLPFQNLSPSMDLDLHCYTASGRLTVVCCPKTPKVHPELVRFITHWKYVVNTDQPPSAIAKDARVLPTTALGLAYEGKHIARPPLSLDSSKIYLTPMDPTANGQNTNEGLDANTALALKLSQQYGYSFTPQIHKLLGVE